MASRLAERGQPFAIALGNLAERAIANGGRLGLRLAGGAGIADFRPEQAIVADGFADQLAIVIEMGEFDDACGRRPVSLRPGAFAGALQRAVGLHFLQDFTQGRAFLAFQLQAAGDFLLGGGAGIVLEKIKDGLSVWECHTRHIGRIAPDCAPDLR
jgi:hypothetical protein